MLRFRGNVNGNYQYFFLIRNAADNAGQNGPIPVIAPPYLNGFATGPNTATAAFTDMVEFSQVQRQPTVSGYGVYHLPGGIAGDPNRNIFAAHGEPDISGASSGTTLSFELDLSRLTPPTGETDPNLGNLPRYLQVNAIATSTTPIDPTNVDPAKVVDAFGDQRLGSGSFNTFLTIDTLQGGVYTNSQSPADPTYEPEADAYPSDRDPALDLVSWSIRVIGR